MKKSIVLSIIFIIALTLIPACSVRNAKSQPVRHVILWTLSDTLSAEHKLELMKFTADDVAELEKVIPGVISMDVYYEGRLESSNCDFMFDFRFESEEALESFLDNPFHLEVAAKLKPFISARTCLDILE